jgi:four helix bundle protein
MFGFEKLEVWKKAIKFCEIIFEIVVSLPKLYQFSLGNNLIRASISISNNIAEGTGRKSKKEANNFYNISKKSVYESVNMLIILSRKSLINKDKFNKIYKKAEEISKMLTGLSTYALRAPVRFRN